MGTVRVILEFCFKAYSALLWSVTLIFLLILKRGFSHLQATNAAIFDKFWAMISTKYHCN